MKFQKRLITAAAVVAAAFFAPMARALVQLEDGKDHLFIDGSVEMGYDSNIFAHAQSGGSLSYQGTLSTEFTRRAGWIGVNVTASVDYTRYQRYHSQDSTDPKISAELTKQTGRTTGSVTLSVQKVDHADVNVNTRDSSWIYDAGLNLQYPVIERYSFSGSFDFNHVDYLDKTLFTDTTAYTGSLFLYYILNEQRDLFINYRARYTDEGNGERDVDNALSGGVSGRVVGPFNGSVQVGYQARTTYDTPGDGTYDDLTASGSMTWNINRRIALTADVSKDYATTANALSVESTSAGMTLQDSISNKAVGNIDCSIGENKFLGVQGLTAPEDQRRVDQFISAGWFYSYRFDEHLKIQISYSYYRSWSNVDYASFPREQLNASLFGHF